MGYAHTSQERSHRVKAATDFLEKARDTRDTTDRKEQACEYAFEALGYALDTERMQEEPEHAPALRMGFTEEETLQIAAIFRAGRDGLRVIRPKVLRKFAERAVMFAREKKAMR